MSQNSSTLKRSLGLWAIVGLGLGYMTPTTVFDTFGIVSGETNGVVPLAYLVALVAMVFTAVSYGRMTRFFPSAGSAYTYTSETMHPNVGFLVGWASLLDYLLLPLVNAVIVRIYMESFFPDVPSWIWVVAYVVVITAMNLWSMNSTSKINGILVVFEIVLIGAFVVLAWNALAHGTGTGAVFSSAPLFHGGVDASAVISGATVVCFSFIGFDAITMYTEEAKDATTVPKAIVLALLIGGTIFFVAAWFGQSVFPTLDGFDNTDDTLPEMALKVGGQLFKVLFTSAAFAATVASSLASHASVSRMIYVMGRNGRGPVSRFFSFVHPRFRTPSFAVLFVGAVSLLAIPFTLEFISSMINFGALIAFTFVNLTVVVFFVLRKKEIRTPKEVLVNIVLPVIGMVLTGVLWANLQMDALVYGAIWLGIGAVCLLVITRGFRRTVNVSMNEEDAVELEHLAGPRV
ncbi:APC family permease [Sinomonas atrocyanea]|jgi:putrescine importer|uniref:APC family permease n=1 Tax=Sinomonas atrocyanea TaxID=37927 RepID=UPI002788F4F8|nr:APC family permease [Sinomonas atrocyanea]MDQ0260262.1 putrescine importer [Sinomonas atrocyanea]MDR6620323.1 putrescine importer [Sinomonas atrocyanea]